MPPKPKFSSVAAPVEKPLPLWILYPLFFTAIYLTHYTLLRLPFFWDEAGYYIPAALDFYQTGSLIPHSTLTNAHPPLPSLLLAAWWHLAGYVISGTRTFIAMIAAAALLGVFRLARTLAGTPIAAAVTLLTAIYPIWFTQSTLAHADIFAAAFTLWALSFYFGAAPNRNATAILFSLAALSKETAIVTPVALRPMGAHALHDGKAPAHLPFSAPNPDSAPRRLVRLPPARDRLHLRQSRVPALQRNRLTCRPYRVLLSLWHRLVHLTFHMNLYVPILCTIAVLFLPGPQTWYPIFRL